MPNVRVSDKTYKRLLRLMGVFQIDSNENISLNDAISRLLNEVEPKYKAILNEITQPKTIKVEGV